MTINEYLNKKKDFEFYVLNINKKTPEYNDIINVFLDSIINPYVYEDSNYTIVLSTIVNNDIIQIVNAIVEDFGFNLKVFKSNKVSSNEFKKLDILKDMYIKYENYINQSFINIQTLAQTIIEKNIADLDIIKPIILNKIINDSKLYEIVNGMFMNDLNVCKTANYVYMHRNTINNKLIVIKEETGLDIQKFQDAVILYVLLKK